MDTIEFRSTRTRDGVREEAWVEVRVNGAPLGDLVRQAELRHLGGRDPSVAGRYAGVPAADGLHDPKYFLPASAGVTGPGVEPVMVAGCICGESGCWPLACVIEVGTDVVVWHSFQNPHLLDTAYAGVGPLRFDRREYERALAAAATTRGG